MKKVVLGLTLGFMSLTANAITKIEQAKNFAQNFYDWYGTQHNGYHDVINHKSGIVHPDFLQELQAGENCPEDDSSCIIDVEPFYASQDPCDFYQAEKVTYQNGKYNVTMVGDCGQKISVTLVPNGQSFYIQSARHID